MELFVMAAITSIVALIVRRKDAFRLSWQPDRHTWVAVGTGLLTFVLSASLLLFERGSFAAHLIHYGLIYVVCGFAIPWGYLLLVERGSASGMGFKRDGWLVSLLLSLLMAAMLNPILFNSDLGDIGWQAIARSAFVLTGAGGLFELFLYYGFIHLRLEKAFGLIPAILATSVLYVLWHTGTQLPLEPDPLAAIWKLFLVGVMYQSFFSLTRNSLIIWPFFHLAGVLLDFAVNIGAIEIVGLEFPWAVGTLVSMAICGLFLFQLARNT
jgi:membrane protease YdiL (CAAX protease family)